MKFSLCSFVHRVNQKCCGKCADESNDAHLSGDNDHPKFMEEVMTHLLHCMDQNQSEQNDNQTRSMLQMEVQCHHCHEKGHIAMDCPKLKANKAGKAEAKLSAAQLVHWNFEDD